MKQELYHWLYQMDLYREHFSNDGAMKAAMLNAVKFYEMVHGNGGHLVGPINLHELLIDPEDGHFEVEAGGDRDALMQDIDSVKFMPPEILNMNSVKFMPPEILNMKSLWSLDADKFVLAEALFALRYCKHPYDGRKVLERPITDVNTARQLYGNCRFIFDPDDSANGLDYFADPGPMDAWTHDSNAELKDAFLQIFTHGYLDTSYRLGDSDWKQLLD